MSEKDLFDCPLECGARIKNLEKHLKKCKNKKLLGTKYKICEYNSYHIIKNELYDLHLLSCKPKISSEDDDDEDSFDDNLKKKFDEDKSNSDIHNHIENNKNKDEENKKKINVVINRKKKRYKHENALFKNESEIDKECLEFFNKVYV